MKFIKSLLKHMKGNIKLYILSFIAIIFSNLFQLLIPLAIKITIDSIIGTQEISNKFIKNYFIKFGGREFFVRNLWIVSIIIILISLLQNIFLYYKGKYSAISSENIIKNLKDKLFNHIQLLPFEYHIKSDTGDLIQRATQDVETVRKFLANQLIEMFRIIMLTTISLIIIFSINVKLALLSTMLIPIIFLFSSMFFIKIQKVFQNADELEGKLTSNLQENLIGIRVVKAFGKQKFEIEKFDKNNQNYRDAIKELIKTLALFWSSSDFLCILQIGIVILFGVLFNLKGIISLGTFIAFVSYVEKLIWPVRELGRILSDMGQAVVSLSRIDEILNEKTEIELDKECIKLTPKINGNIDINNLSFEYEKDKPVLKNINLSIKAGETIAILGNVGSGKSTLMHILTKLYDYNKGSIKIDGVELKDIDRFYLRKNIGIVLQDPFLYSKTIKDNISIANKNKTLDDIFFAADIASVHDVILSFKKGYDTILGEQGVTLSGGQKQRIAIARTIIEDKPILIFDDSLSAVDSSTDLMIRTKLKEKRKQSTTIIIAHRISTLMEADKIIVLEDGEITNVGTHNELIQVEGLYQKIYEIEKNIKLKSLDSEV
ncbi:MAG: ATP-binding cassette, subfamily bacterial [Fusobacteriaceae bacterium]|jgi:ATP-binding cassette subfamily B protein|nr:ATP-binding cassette, subfamily bacterial [Fusobacteriaceae bacterium]